MALAFAETLQAQVISDPRVAEFDPSPDHWAVLDSGEPAILRYELGVYLLGASAPVGTSNIGKPSPDPDGKIRYNFSSQVAAWYLPGGSYEARVSAVGPEGTALSDPSNPFTFTSGSSCTASLSARTASVPASGGDYAVDVSTGAGCGWTATTTLPWVTILTGSGSGSGMMPFSVQANSSSSSRTGTINIGGQTLTVTQAAAAGIRTPLVTWANPASIVYGTALSGNQLNATANVNGTFTYNPPAGTTLNAGPGQPLSVTFTPADTLNYTTAAKQVTIDVIAGPPNTLTITLPAGGTVQGAGLNCGAGGTACAVTMPAPMRLGITATASSGYTFTGWSGDCSGTASSTWVDLNGPRTCSATFTPSAGSSGGGGGGLPTGPPYTLTITPPTGGKVQGAGLNCGAGGAACAVTMPAAMTLGIEATASAGYTFAGWSGDCLGTAAGVWVDLKGARTCAATFTPAGSTTSAPTIAAAPTGGSGLPTGPPHTLTITPPTGGKVQGAGLNCGAGGAACAVTMPAAMTLGIEATASAGYTFAGWSGNCSGTAAGVWVDLKGARTCAATFTAAGGAASAPTIAAASTGGVGLPTGPPYTLTITPPTGGKIQGAGLSCGGGATACSVTMPAAMTLGLQATADAGYTFTGWSGGCSGASTGIWVNLNGSRTCAATFTR
jgi:uncharacterized repeat protein (TIGR02543 family)